MRQPAKTLAQIEKEMEDEKKPREKRDAPKELVIERRPDGLYFIRYTAGGEVPDSLKGAWTSIVKAQAAIDNYLVTKQEQAA